MNFNDKMVHTNVHNQSTNFLMVNDGGKMGGEKLSNY